MEKDFVCQEDFGLPNYRFVADRLESVIYEFEEYIEWIYAFF